VLEQDFSQAGRLPFLSPNQWCHSTEGTYLVSCAPLYWPVISVGQVQSPSRNCWPLLRDMVWGWVWTLC